jgi:hypothetical protein
MDSNDLSDRKKPTPLEEKAWFQIGFADRPVIELATELRSVAEPPEILPFPTGPFPFDTAIRGLLRLCPQAWSAAEAGEVSPYGAPPRRRRHCSREPRPAYLPAGRRRAPHQGGPRGGEGDSAGGHSQGQREDAGGASLAQEHGGNGHRPAAIDLIVNEQDQTGAGVGLDGGGEVIRDGQGAPE